MFHRQIFKKTREEGPAEEAARLRLIAGMLPPGVRLSRIEADPELTSTAARLLAPQ